MPCEVSCPITVTIKHTSLTLECVAPSAVSLTVICHGIHLALCIIFGCVVCSSLHSRINSNHHTFCFLVVMPSAVSCLVTVTVTIMLAALSSVILYAISGPVTVTTYTIYIISVCAVCNQLTQLQPSDHHSLCFIVVVYVL